MSFNSLEILEKNFRFLEDEFGFIKTHEEFSPKFFGNAQIIYKSDSVAISIVDDRRQVFINMGSPTWPEREWFDFTDIVHVFNPALEEVYQFPDSVSNAEERVQIQAERLAQILRDNCVLILKGDFSMAPKINELEQRRANRIMNHLKSLSPGKKREATGILPTQIKDVNMEDKITLLQAYKAMLQFLEDLYYREGRPDNLGGFLGELQIIEDGKTADPAAWYDWLEVVKKVTKAEQE